MNYTSVLRGLSYLTFFLYVGTSMLLLGGLNILIKVGTSPEGVWWSEIPAVTLALATVIAQALVGERVLNARMPVVIRIILSVQWIGVFAVFCTTLPLYMLASQTVKSLPETVTWIKNEGSISYWIMFAIVASAELGVVGLLTAAGYDKSHAQKVTKEKQTLIASGVGPNQRNVLQAMTGSSGSIQQTVEVLIVSTEPNLNESQVRVALKALMESGQVKDVGGRPKVYELGIGG